MNRRLLHIVRRITARLQRWAGEPCGHCGDRAAYLVTWSDREACCCEAHLGSVKHAAANDNSGDRTDNPHIEVIRR